MRPGFNVFADLPGKARDFVRKRPLEFLFLFAALAAAASLISAYKANAADISLVIEGRGAILPLIKVYGVSPGGSVLELDRRGRAWVRDDGEYFLKLLIALPKNTLAGITSVRAGIGKRNFEFNAADIRSFRLLRLGAVENYEWDVYELPDSARNSRSLFITFAPVNWRGDAFLCMSAVIRFFLYCLCLFLIFALLNPSYVTGRGPRGDPADGISPAKTNSIFSYLSSKNRTVWTFQSARQPRDLNLGRPFHLSFVFLLTVGVVGALAVLQVDPHHDGVMLKPAFDVAAGQTLFRDTFTQYGALTTWVQALAVKVAGKYLLVIRLLTALIYGFIAVLMWLIYSRFLPNYLNTFSCLSWLFLGYFFLNHPAMFIVPWATVFAVCSALFSLYLMLRFLESGSRCALFASGFVAALTFWFKINYGGASFLASLLFLAILLMREERRRAAGIFAAFLGGYLATHALFAAWLAAHGSFRDFVLQSVRFALAFSGNNAFSTNEHAAVRLVKNLFQVDSPHGGMSYLWMVLPLASCAVFFRSAYAFALKKDATGKNKALLAVSSAAIALWLGYYPIPALFHMYLSSVIFFGLLSYSVLATAARLGFSGNRLLVLAILVMMFLPDFSYRFKSFTRKMAGASSWERIETPKFLRGMYVTVSEKKTFAEMEKWIYKSPGRLINLTNSGLYSLYKDDGLNFHRMYMDWGWANSFLYPDYIPAVARQILTGEGCILSYDIYMVPGYIPVKVFPAFVAGEIINKPIVLLLPGRQTRRLKFAGVDAVLRPRAYDRFPCGYRFRLKAGNVPALIDSVVVKVISKGAVQYRIPRNEYEYELLPKIFDPTAKELVKKRYLLDRERNEYITAVPMDGKAGLELMEALSGVFLYEKRSFLADTFLASENPKITVYRNGKAVGHSELFDGAGYKAGDSIDFVAPAAAIPDNYVARIRINYKGGSYQEEIVKVFKK